MDGRMKDFCQLSGPWTGMSTQDMRRIPEAIQLRIDQNQILGTGTDADGHFELSGSYDPKSGRVTMTRRYTWTAEPSQEGVGVPYHYDGLWDGGLVSGFWHCRPAPSISGPFEMWPDREEDRLELQINLRELSLSGS